MHTTPRSGFITGNQGAPDYGARQLIDPVPILPSQYFARTGFTPEQRLLAAVLEQAIEDIRIGRQVDPQGRRARFVATATSWVQDDDASWLGSFRVICTVLGLNADAVRARIAAGLPMATTREGARRRKSRRQTQCVSRGSRIKLRER